MPASPPDAISGSRPGGRSLSLARPPAPGGRRPPLLPGYPGTCPPPGASPERPSIPHPGSRRAAGAESPRGGGRPAPRTSSPPRATVTARSPEPGALQPSRTPARGSPDLPMAGSARSGVPAAAALLLTAPQLLGGRRPAGRSPSPGAARPPPYKAAAAAGVDARGYPAGCPEEARAPAPRNPPPPAPKNSASKGPQ